jgi:hypothetical protein
LKQFEAGDAVANLFYAYDQAAPVNVLEMGENELIRSAVI